METVYKLKEGNCTHRLQSMADTPIVLGARKPAAYLARSLSHEYAKLRTLVEGGRGRIRTHYHSVYSIACAHCPLGAGVQYGTCNKVHASSTGVPSEPVLPEVCNSGQLGTHLRATLFQYWLDPLSNGERMHLA